MNAYIITPAIGPGPRAQIVLRNGVELCRVVYDLDEADARNRASEIVKALQAGERP